MPSFSYILQTIFSMSSWVGCLYHERANSHYLSWNALQQIVIHGGHINYFQRVEKLYICQASHRLREWVVVSLYGLGLLGKPVELGSRSISWFFTLYQSQAHRPMLLCFSMLGPLCNPRPSCAVLGMWTVLSRTLVEEMSCGLLIWSWLAFEVELGPKKQFLKNRLALLFLNNWEFFVKFMYNSYNNLKSTRKPKFIN